MPSFKPDLQISVSVRGRSFSIGGMGLPNGKYLIKRGRLISDKMPTATMTEIFTSARKWAVKQIGTK